MIGLDAYAKMTLKIFLEERIRSYFLHRLPFQGLMFYEAYARDRLNGEPPKTVGPKLGELIERFFKDGAPPIDLIAPKVPEEYKNIVFAGHTAPRPPSNLSKDAKLAQGYDGYDGWRGLPAASKQALLKQINSKKKQLGDPREDISNLTELLEIAEEKGSATKNPAYIGKFTPLAEAVQDYILANIDKNFEFYKQKHDIFSRNFKVWKRYWGGQDEPEVTVNWLRGHTNAVPGRQIIDPSVDDETGIDGSAIIKHFHRFAEHIWNNMDDTWDETVLSTLNGDAFPTKHGSDSLADPPSYEDIYLPWWPTSSKYPGAPGWTGAGFIGAYSKCGGKEQWSAAAGIGWRATTECLDGMAKKHQAQTKKMGDIGQPGADLNLADNHRRGPNWALWSCAMHWMASKVQHYYLPGDNPDGLDKETAATKAGYDKYEYLSYRTVKDLLLREIGGEEDDAARQAFDYWGAKCQNTYDWHNKVRKDFVTHYSKWRQLRMIAYSAYGKTPPPEGFLSYLGKEQGPGIPQLRIRKLYFFAALVLDDNNWSEGFRDLQCNEEILAKLRLKLADTLDPEERTKLEKMIKELEDKIKKFKDEADVFAEGALKNVFTEFILKMVKDITNYVEKERGLELDDARLQEIKALGVVARSRAAQALSDAGAESPVDLISRGGIPNKDDKFDTSPNTGWELEDYNKFLESMIYGVLEMMKV